MLWVALGELKNLQYILSNGVLSVVSGVSEREREKENKLPQNNMVKKH